MKLARCLALAAVVASVLLVLPLSVRDADAKGKGCPAGMVSVHGTFCIDKYEAGVVEIVGKKKTRRHPPYEPVDGLEVKAVSKKGIIPQAYISRDQAEAACKNAGKRLCTDEEWVTACKGRHPTTWPYGDEHESGACNDEGFSSFNHYYGPKGGGEPTQDAYTWANMNDPRLDRMKGTVAKTGSFKKCRSSFGAYDMVGNLHEWTSDPAGTFRGGYYLDTHQNGDGCDYRTGAHVRSYHDYSTGFRCCK